MRVHKHALAVGFAALLSASAPAQALEIVNDHDKPVKVLIEGWVRFMGPHQSARFRPFEDPTLIKIELDVVRLQCEAGADDQVRLADNNCYVNGELVAEGQFHM